LDLGGDSGGTGELMRQTLMQLESLGEENTPKTIADIQKAQIQSLVYERQINELTDKAAFVQTTVARFDNSQLSIINTDMRERLTSLLELRMNLLVKLLDRNQQALKNWSLLLNAQNQFNDQIRLFDKLLKENLLWTPTTPPMSPAWLLEFAAGFQRVGLAWANLSQLLDSLAWPLAGIALAYGLFRLLLHFYWRPGYLAWQKEANACVGNSRRDAFRNTLAMLAVEFLFTLPMPLMLLSVKKLLGHAGEDEIWVRLLGEALRVAAIASLMSGWLWRLARPGGFLEGQLSWPAAFVKTLFRELRWRWLLVALVAYVYVSETQTNTFFRYELGRFPFLGFCVLLGLMLRTLSLAWRADLASKNLPSLKANEWPFWLGSVFVLGEIGLAGMEVFGFHLGAFVLQERLLRTLGWTVLIVLLHQIGQRWLLLEQRRMAYAHAMAVREERRAASKDKSVAEPLPGTVREEFAEIQSISLQSKTLLALLAASAFLAALAWIWADMIPAFYLLDQVVLWEIPATGSGGVGFEPVTLKAFLLALALIGLIGLAMRNLPAMFQLLVLQHLDLPPGNDFAITTLLKYGIFVGGVVVVCKLLGLQWSELQWLVAALSVGLGFGLQEIFANFISGLIILFEKPVRIGDIVTLSNGVTGTIDAINTRATMLTDWDNKEIIIPNKTLITEQLTNWSLSSPIIRVIIPVGIAYGSDTELACRLLRQAAEEHPNVLKKPPIAVLFRAFGDSALNFELRCFIAEPGVSLGTVHDLNMRINQLFRENGVEIAFPQMDLHIRGGAKPAV
jgi:potassium efflux system protein